MPSKKSAPIASKRSTVSTLGAVVSGVVEVETFGGAGAGRLSAVGVMSSVGVVSCVGGGVDVAEGNKTVTSITLSV